MYVGRCRTFKKHFKEIVNVKFKKMTERQRNYGKVISIAVLTAIVLLGVLSSCTIYKQPQMKITSVLAVTAEGDTLKLPIDAIRPIYNYNNYPRSYYPYNNFYYTPNRYYPVYGQQSNNTNGYSNNNNNSTPNYITPSNSSFGGTGSVGNSGGNPNVSTPPPNPAVSNPRKNN